MEERTCSIVEDGKRCPKRAKTRGWCAMHYMRWWKHGDPLKRIVVVAGVCSIKDCGRVHYGRGWCQKHYDLWRDHGDPLWVRPTRAPGHCAIEGCPGSDPICRGWCTVHYMAWYNYGTPTPYRPSVEERFWANVDKDGPIPERCPDLGPCWLWTAMTDGDGYGRVKVDGRLQFAHRVAYVWVTGLTVSPTLCLHHRCYRPTCVNPLHLEPLTRAAHMALHHHHKT